MVINIISSKISKTNYEKSASQIIRWANIQDNRCVYVANVHMLMEGHDRPDFQTMINNADLVTPDGMPLVWLMRIKGERNQPRVYGPDLMLYVLEASVRENIPVGFYGGTTEVLVLLIEKLQSRYENLKVVYSFSPPFRELTFDENEGVFTEIEKSGARILFVGLGCPKQEIWMSTNRDRLKLVMIGVGAAFDFHAGIKPQAPTWMQRIGFEWLFRLLTEPGRLWKRYIYHNPRFVALAIADLFGFFR